MLTLADVIQALTGQRWENAARHLITEAVVDSRSAIPGALFIALSGRNVDGHDFVDDALHRGAELALIQRQVAPNQTVLDLRAGKIAEEPNWDQVRCLLVPDSLKALQQIAGFWRRKLDARVIGITGSVGKSTTKELVAEVLSRRYRTIKNQGNLNNEIGLPLTLLSMAEGHQRAVLEMGFYVPGEIALLSQIAQPQVGVITNIGTVHAERAGSQEMIAQGKAELVQALPADGVAVLNYDDPFVREMASLTQAQVFFYGLDANADLWVDDVEGLGLEGIRFRLHHHGETLYLRVPLLGRHSVHTALRAAAVGLVEGLDWQEIVEGLRAGHMNLRLVAVPAINGALLLDDTYNASPASTIAALNLLADLDGRKVAVLGDMLELGLYEREGHQKVGLRAADVAEVLVTVGQRAQLIAQTAQQTGLPRLVIECEDSQSALDWLQNNISSEDVVLVKGSRGMHMDRIVAALEVRQ